MDSQVEAASRKSRPSQRTPSQDLYTVPESFRSLCKYPFCFGETYHEFGACSVTKPDNFHLQLPIQLPVLSFNKMDDMSGCGLKGQCAGTVSTATKHFAAPKSKEEIEKARIQSIPKKTREDTAYCVRIWGNWYEYSRDSSTITYNTINV